MHINNTKQNTVTISVKGNVTTYSLNDIELFVQPDITALTINNDEDAMYIFNNHKAIEEFAFNETPATDIGKVLYTYLQHPDVAANIAMYH